MRGAAVWEGEGGEMNGSRPHPGGAGVPGFGAALHRSDYTAADQQQEVCAAAAPMHGLVAACIMYHVFVTACSMCHVYASLDVRSKMSGRHRSFIASTSHTAASPHVVPVGSLHRLLTLRMDLDQHI